MTLYANFNDMLQALGRDEMITLTDRDRTDEPQEAVAITALTKASAKADSYLGQRYDLPLSSVPLSLVETVIDMAVYNLARSGDLMTDDIKDRNSEALRFLRDLANGKATLGIDEPNNSNPGGADGSDAVLFTGGEDMIMSRENLKGM